jgi:putative FmdB family regulatory protein
VPTYQYACTECGGQIEAVQRFTDDPLTVHDACGGRLRKVFSPVGIVFKGSGFYRTDSRKGSSASEAKPAAPEAKPAAPAPAAPASSDTTTTTTTKSSSSGEKVA